jgi:hypothetical protein
VKGEARRWKTSLAKAPDLHRAGRFGLSCGVPLPRRCGQAQGALLLVLITLILLARPEASLLAQTEGGATTPSGTGYSLTWWTVDGGGSNLVSNGAYTLSSTAGQPYAGVVAANGYTLGGGFWGGGGTVYQVYLPVVMRALP